jgi:HTH-type transcriptional regulator/antitoxin HigA
LFEAETGTIEADRLEILTALVETYENQHYSIPLPDPVEAILYFIESRGLTRKDLEVYWGSRARVSEILNRKRPLSLEMIRRLHRQVWCPGCSSHSEEIGIYSEDLTFFRRSAAVLPDRYGRRY